MEQNLKYKIQAYNGIVIEGEFYADGKEGKWVDKLRYIEVESESKLTKKRNQDQLEVKVGRPVQYSDHLHYLFLFPLQYVFDIQVESATDRSLHWTNEGWIEEWISIHLYRHLLLRLTLV